MTTVGSTRELAEALKRDAMKVATFMFFGGYAVGFLMGACTVWFLS